MSTKIKFLALPLFATVCCLSLSLSAARASDDGEEGGDIEGTESLDLEFAMTPTAAAPAGSSIEVSLEADDEDGATQIELQLETKGLPAGTYSVSVTLKSDASTVAVGSFTSDGNEGEAKFESDEDNPLPANVNPFDIATISVLDASNVVIFTADLTNAAAAASMTRNAAVKASPGPGSPGAAGDAMLSAFVSRGVSKGFVQLNGHGLTPNMQLSVVINSANVKKAKSDRTGNISVRLSPKGKTGTMAASRVNLFRVTSIGLVDKFGNVVLKASF